MDIWTERLERRHLPLLERWIERNSGQMTTNDLPLEAGELSQWFEKCLSDPERVDCLVSVYETPVGIVGPRKCAGQESAAELYLLLGETNYNPLRTATYATLRMLDRAFLECGFNRVIVQACKEHEEYLNALERMGFLMTAKKDAMIFASVEKKVYLNRKYLF